MAASEKLFSVKLNEEDVPGARFRSAIVSEHSLLELKRWLACRGLPTNEKKPALIQRCLDCIEAKKDDNIIISIDGGKWYEQKVIGILSRQTNGNQTPIPILPVNGWKVFPSKNIPKNYCYGSIYHHIIASATMTNTNPTNGSDSDDNLTDFNTSKPMLKGRQYFLSGHVKSIEDHTKDECYFLKAKVMASYTQDKDYHVSLTISNESGNVLDASCNCKASAMGRCNHIAALLFALEDYTIQYGYEVACTSKTCGWNIGRKSKREPKPCHTATYSKKMKPDRIISHDPRAEQNSDNHENKYVNDFIASLPNSNSTMFGKLLEIEYEDYSVNKELLGLRTEKALQFLRESCDYTMPMEVPNTRGQSDSSEWKRNRQFRVTASVAKDVANVKSSRGQYSLLQKLLWGKPLPPLKSLKYGRDNEENAFKAYCNQTTDSVTPSGFWINPKYPELGCSPDGLIYNDSKTLRGVLEIKCPLVLENASPSNIESLSTRQKANLCYNIENGEPQLKLSHKYYYQVQMQIAICNVDFCDFVVWSPKGLSVERIQPNVEFWESLSGKLIKFHNNILMPDYLEMRVPRRLLPVDISV